MAGAWRGRGGGVAAARRVVAGRVAEGGERGGERGGRLAGAWWGGGVTGRVAGFLGLLKALNRRPRDGGRGGVRGGQCGAWRGAWRARGGCVAGRGGRGSVVAAGRGACVLATLWCGGAPWKYQRCLIRQFTLEFQKCC